MNIAAPAIAALLLLSGCKIMTVEQDNALRAARGGVFDAAHYVDANWTGRVLPTLEKEAAPLGKGVGRVAAEGAAPTYVVRDTGTVTAISTASRRGTLAFAVGNKSVQIQSGPVVSGTAIRDALPFIAFNDFPDQLAFAEVGNALTAHAMKDARTKLAALKVGDKVTFTGVYQAKVAGDAILVTAVRISGAP